MSRTCMLSGKKPMFGHNVSNANNKTKRVFYPNVHKVRVYSEKLGVWVPMKLSAAAQRTLDKHGGLDRFLQNSPESSLTPAMLLLKKRVLHARGASQARNSEVRL